jgi:hypothetical protein
MKVLHYPAHRTLIRSPRKPASRLTNGLETTCSMNSWDFAALEEPMFIKQRIAIVEWAEDHENLFDDHAVIVLALYFLGSMMFGVAAWKAVVIGAAAYGLVLKRIGPRPIAVLGVLFFLVALTEWSGLGDIRQCFKG